jgi:CO dehydrogenase nickel-insertion accessory protein CooC1
MLTQLVDIGSCDWVDLPHCGFFEILGKRGTGKTTWAQHILQHSVFKKTGIFIVVGGSETAKHSWSKVVHPIFVVDPDTSYLTRLKDAQNEKVRHYQTNNEPFPDDFHVTLIFDDVSSNKKLMRSQIMSYLASNSRHLQMSVFILAQYHCQIVAEVRTQFDYVVALSMSDLKSINRLHAEYCSCVDIRTFRHILTHVTQNHGALVINNQATTSDISDICKYSKIMSYPPILERLGSESAWHYGKDHYINEYDDRPTESAAEKWADDNKVITDHKGKLIIRLQ